MALSKICSFQISSNILLRLEHTVNIFQANAEYFQQSITSKSLDKVKTANVYISGVWRYAEAPLLHLPNNVSEILNNEAGRFTPERTRDIAAPIFIYGIGYAKRDHQRRVWDKGNSSSEYWGSSNRFSDDSHVNSYDCFSTLSLNSSMQSTVPKPYCSTGKSMHLNMPGGQWARDCKYIAEYMQKLHYSAVKQRIPHCNYHNINSTGRVHYSMDSMKNSSENQLNSKNKNFPQNQVKLSNKEKLQRALKDYGSTVVVFHVSISLISLGTFYLIISGGLDVTAMLKMFSISNERLGSIMANSSTFLVAYAVHKVFAPVRISITLGATPFIVRYLRKIGVLKVKKRDCKQ